jgi:adenosine deaminase
MIVKVLPSPGVLRIHHTCRLPLRPDDVNFLQSLPKAGLYAHLNGSIPIKTILELEQQCSNSNAQTSEITDTIKKFKSGIDFDKISDFFSLIPATYALTTTPEAVGTVSRAVLQSFLNPTGDGSEFWGRWTALLRKALADDL